MSTLTTSTEEAREVDSRDAVTRLVLELKGLVALLPTLEARGATDPELDAHQRAIDRVHRDLANAVKQRLAADRQLTNRLTQPRRTTDEPFAHSVRVGPARR